MRLWRLVVLGTSMRCDDTTQSPPPCPLPPWLVQQRHQYYYDRTGLECPVLMFREPRLAADKMVKVYRGAAEPEVRFVGWRLCFWAGAIVCLSFSVGCAAESLVHFKQQSLQEPTPVVSCEISQLLTTTNPFV